MAYSEVTCSNCGKTNAFGSTDSERKKCFHCLKQILTNPVYNEQKHKEMKNRRSGR